MSIWNPPLGIWVFGIWLVSEAGHTGQTVDCFRGCRRPVPAPARAPPKLGKCSSPAYFTSQLSTGLRATASAGELGQGTRRWLRPGEASTGWGSHCWSWCSEGRRLPSLQAVHTTYTLGARAGPCPSAQGRQRQAEEVILCEQQRRAQPHAVCEQGGGSHRWHLHEWNAGASLHLCLLLAHGSPHPLISQGQYTPFSLQ